MLLGQARGFTLKNTLSYAVTCFPRMSRAVAVALLKLHSVMVALKDHVNDSCVERVNGITSGGAAPYMESISVRLYSVVSPVFFT